MFEKEKIAIIGAGRLGEMIIGGLLSSKLFPDKNIIATVQRKSHLEELSKKYNVTVTMDNENAVKEADIIIMSVKPHNFMQVLEQIKSQLSSNKCLISVASAVSIKKIKSQIEDNISVIRVMPNTPCKVLKGMSVISHPEDIDDKWIKFTSEIFNTLGRTMILPEKYMNMVTGLSASGPAFIYIVIESLTDAGVKVGLPRDIATILAAQTVLGSAEMVLQTGEHPALLKDMVTTPAGSTIDGILELEEGGLRVTLIKTVVKAVERAGQLFSND